MGEVGLSARVAEAIHRARRRKGLSQARLSAQLGVGEDTIGDWERGSIPESWLNFIALAEALEVSLDSLARGEESFYRRAVEEARHEVAQEWQRELTELRREIDERLPPKAGPAQ